MCVGCIMIIFLSLEKSNGATAFIDNQHLAEYLEIFIIAREVVHPGDPGYKSYYSLIESRCPNHRVLTDHASKHETQRPS